MTLDLAWDFDWNHSVDGSGNLTTGANFLFAMKRLLCDIGAAPSRWTVLSSSNGVALAGAGGNWASAADVLFAAGAHSWIELLSPAGYPSVGVQTRLVIDANNALGTQASFVVASAPQASAGAGTLTARPTYAADRAFAYASVQIIAGYNGTNINYFHGSRSETGDFVVTATRAGLATATTAANPFAMILAKLDPVRPVVDAWPLYIFAGYFAGDLATQRGPLVLDNGQTGRMGSSVSSKMFWIDGVADNWQTFPGYLSSAGTTVGRPLGTIFSLPGDSIDGDYPFLPIFVGSWAGALGTNQGSIRGRLIDITGGPYGNDLGAVAQGIGTPPGAIRQALLGQLWVPADQEPSV